MVNSWWIEKLVLPILVNVVTLAFATGVAFRFTERWQRARQSRDLQFQTIVSFSEKADRIRAGLAALFPAIHSGVEPEERLREKGLEITRDIASITSDLYRFSIFVKPAMIYSSLVAMVEAARETFRLCWTGSSDAAFNSAFGKVHDHAHIVITESYKEIGFLTREQEDMMAHAVRTIAASSSNQ